MNIHFKTSIIFTIHSKFHLLHNWSFLEFLLQTQTVWEVDEITAELPFATFRFSSFPFVFGDLVYFRRILFWNMEVKSQKYTIAFQFLIHIGEITTSFQKARKRKWRRSSRRPFPPRRLTITGRRIVWFDFKFGSFFSGSTQEDCIRSRVPRQ